MATSFVAYTSGNTDNSASVVLNKPTGTINGDVLILMVSVDGTGGTKTPTGFTKIGSQTVGDSHRNEVYWRVASGEPTNYTFENNSNERGWFGLATYREVDNTTPIDSFDLSSTGSSGTDGAIPTFTPTADDCMVVAFQGHENGNAGNGIISSWPGSFTERSDNVNGPPGTGAASSAGAFADDIQTTKADVSGTITLSDASNWGTFVFALKEGTPPPIGLITAPTQVDIGDTNKVVTGWGFEAVQGTGKVEIGNNEDYASCTVKTTQTIDTWADTSIQFDINLTGHTTQGVVWFYVTNDSDDVSGAIPSFTGKRFYYQEVLAMTNAPDIYCRLNNNYNDEHGNWPFGILTVGSVGFQAVPLAIDSTHCWAPNDAASRTEMTNNSYTNINITHTQRLIAFRIQLPQVFLSPTGCWEEGGGVNNIYAIVGFGNILLANIADSNSSPEFKVQTFSDFKLTVDRTYHIAIKFIGASEFSLFIDGIKMAVVSGDLGTATEMSTHSGGLSIGKPDTTLDTGGTDIQYPSGEDLLIADWMTFSAYGNGLCSDAEIRDILFEQGAIATDEVDKDTEANMQTDIDLLADNSYVDKPLPIKINAKTADGDLDLDFDNITFDERCSMHVQWLGETGDTLTITNLNGGNIDLDKCSTPYGGTIVITTPYTVTFTGMDDGATIKVYDSSDDTLIGSIESSSGDFSVSVLAANIDYMITEDVWKLKQSFDVAITADITIPVVQEQDYVDNS